VVKGKELISWNLIKMLAGKSEEKDLEMTKREVSFRNAAFPSIL
jgi:hypothetical protein